MKSLIKVTSVCFNKVMNTWCMSTVNSPLYLSTKFKYDYYCFCIGFKTVQVCFFYKVSWIFGGRKQRSIYRTVGNSNIWNKVFYYFMKIVRGHFIVHWFPCKPKCTLSQNVTMGKPSAGLLAPAMCLDCSRVCPHFQPLPIIEWIWIGKPDSDAENISLPFKWYSTFGVKKHLDVWWVNQGHQRIKAVGLM